MSVVRYNVSLSPDVAERINTYCASTRIQRSTFISLACTQYLDAVEAMPSVQKMLAAMSSVVDGTLKGELPPDEAKSQMDSISASYKLLTGKDL